MINAVPLNASKKRYNEEFIDLLDKLSGIMMKHGEPFRAKAYQKAQDSILKYKGEITSVHQLLGFYGIGSTIMDKFEEYVKTGTFLSRFSFLPL